MTTARSRWRVTLSHAVYDLLVHLACLLAMPPWLVKVGRDRAQGGWIRQRLGGLPPGIPAGRPVWVHAVSVGEVKASRPLVQSLRARHGDVPLVLSTATLTGYQTARKLYPDLYVFPLPLDLSWVVRRVLRRIAPRLIILLELEVWPALMRAADEADVPQVILSARVRRSSFRTYRALRWFLPEFDRIDLVAAQDEVYRDRIASLGVPAERLVVAGNLKHDLTSQADSEAVRDLARRAALVDGHPVFVAGSTHDGEDGPVVQAWLEAGGGESCHLALVPRHLDRLKEIERLLKRLGVAWQRLSECGPARPPSTLLLVDSMGELEAFFGLADVVFLGGSLVPVGGHNVLEPAAAGRGVLVGPHLETCRREADILAEAGGLLVVDDGPGLATELRRLLADGESRREMGEAASRAVRSLTGATAAALRLLHERGFLTDQSLDPEPETTNLGRPQLSRTPPTGASSP